MPLFLQLSLTALAPILVSVGMYLLDKKTAFNKINPKLKQVIFGVIFGGLAVLATEVGVNIDGATANVRDASVIIAGLLFGAPAGIIAGCIGGVERFFAVYWGASEFTQIACSVSTVLAGIIAALLRKYMFDDKKPPILYAFGIGLVTEVFHFLMIFFTKMSVMSEAFVIVEKLALPMILINSISVMLSVFVIRLLSKEISFTFKNRQHITGVFSRWLLLCVVIAFCVTSLFTFFLQYRISQHDTKELLRLNIRDVQQDVLDASDKNMLKVTWDIADIINSKPNNEITNEFLDELAIQKGVPEICIIDRAEETKGIVTVSTNRTYLGYDMASDPKGQASEFLVLLDGETEEYVQNYQPVSVNQNVSRKFVGVVLQDEKFGFVQVGYDAGAIKKETSEQVVGATKNRHIGQSGCIIIVDESWNIVSDRYDNQNKNLDVTGIWIDVNTEREGDVFKENVYGESAFVMYYITEGFKIIAVYPEGEAVFSRNLSVYTTVFIEIIVFVGLFILIYFLVKKLVVNNIQKVNNSLAQITGGNLDVTVDVRDSEEFASLSDDINSTVDTLKHYIEMAAARIDKELEFAKSIQYSALPSVFPPYPDRTDFDLFARMDTAKEVGGDFYDFYLTRNNELVFMIADVSGKGIPAAMFMMRAKTLLKGHIEAGLELDEAFTRANNDLCENNIAEMFVTAWLGKIDLSTGQMTFVNAGHNPPVVIKKSGEMEYLKSRPGLVLAGMENVKYRKNLVELEEGDIIFLYTDGVTEATDEDNKLFGEDRLIQSLKDTNDKSAKDICQKVKLDVDTFVGNAPQFDDITMLCIRYNKKYSDEK